MPPEAELLALSGRQTNPSISDNMDFSELELRVIGKPWALGAPFGPAAQRQWEKRVRLWTRLRIAQRLRAKEKR